jgi:hypothetical protein
MAGSRARWALALLACGLVSVSHAAVSDAAAPAKASLEAYRADVARMQALVAACAASTTACDVLQVPRDAEVGDAGHGGFAVHWAWLRDALTDAIVDAKQSKSKERDAVLSACAERLQEMAQQTSETNADDAQARAAADAVLRHPEFRSGGGPTWWDRQKAKWLGWLGRIFDGLGALGASSPFLAPLFEWLLFGGAAVGLVFFLIRAAARQRGRVALSAGAVQSAAWDREATDWAQLAALHAAAEEWREAVHCLYWSAIVLLEARRAWRHNPARTPREYVRLLRPGSEQQQGLRGLTQVFERVWYGFGAADRSLYERARESYERVAGDGLSTEVA